jgi:hypothetical protein
MFPVEVEDGLYPLERFIDCRDSEGVVHGRRKQV